MRSCFAALIAVLSLSGCALFHSGEILPAPGSVAEGQTPLDALQTGSVPGPAQAPVDAGTQAEATETEATPASEPAACALGSRFVHNTRYDGDRVVLADDQALVLRSVMAVNTDGAPNSFHPKDPWGETGLAINTVCNAMSVFAADRRIVRPDQCRKLVSEFEHIRDGNWEPEDGARLILWGVARQGDRRPEKYRPCLNQQAPYAGYMIAPTALAADPEKGLCEQGRYLNALEVPFIIRPSGREFALRGVDRGDLAMVLEPVSGRMSPAIIGDIGPGWISGEGSVALHKALRGVETLPQSRGATRVYGAGETVTVIFPKEAIPPGPITPAAIAAAAQNAFSAFGGLARLRACDAELVADPLAPQVAATPAAAQ
ncbi:MAG: hypothetical protein MRY63_14485 [Neomegalonema sp.]|nr:hypothetical protein [Neomegalonema sp.]